MYMHPPGASPTAGGLTEWVILLAPRGPGWRPSGRRDELRTDAGA